MAKTTRPEIGDQDRPVAEDAHAQTPSHGRRVFCHGFQLISLLFFGLPTIIAPYLLSSGAPKNSSVRSVVELSISLGAILVIMGLISTGIARLISRETLWLKPYVITLLIVIIVQDAITALGVCVWFK
jgi:hypothetical protein